MEIESSIVRQGKTMSFVRSDLYSDSKVGTTALFAFGATRKSGFDEVLVAPAAHLPPPEDCQNLFVEGKVRPVFTGHFEARLAQGGRPATASTAVDHWIWVRHKGADDSGGVDGVPLDIALLALADMPPPAIVAKFQSFFPIASATWQVRQCVPRSTCELAGNPLPTLCLPAGEFPARHAAVGRRWLVAREKPRRARASRLLLAGHDSLWSRRRGSRHRASMRRNFR